VQNFDSIVQVADGIMVAKRGLELNFLLNKFQPSENDDPQMLSSRKARHHSNSDAKSMIKNPRPTRAEVSDVANAIYDSTSAVMLSGETAVGAYSIETVKMMKTIVNEAEKDFNYQMFSNRDSQIDFNDVSNSVALATVKTAYSAQAKSILSLAIAA